MSQTKSLVGTRVRLINSLLRSSFYNCTGTIDKVHQEGLDAYVRVLFDGGGRASVYESDLELLDAKEGADLTWDERRRLAEKDAR